MAAHQVEGWPLGLQPLNVRIGLGRTRDYFGSMSFKTTTILTGSPTSSTDFSSDLDTQSTGSFFHDRSITLGSLLGVSNILELSRRSIRGRIPKPMKGNKKPCRSKPWIISLCSRESIDIKDTTTTTTNTTPSLGQYLAVERQGAYNDHRRNQSPSITFVPDEISFAQPATRLNSLFVNDQIVPPQSCQKGVIIRHVDHSYGVPVLLSCMCGQD